MPKEKSLPARRNRKWIWKFAFTLFILLGASVLLRSQLITFYQDNAIDFELLGAKKGLVFSGLTRAQHESLKLGYTLSDNYRRPSIGIFGSHLIQFFGRRAFGPRPDGSVIFNYEFADMNLVDVRNYLFYLAARDRLPQDLILVHIANPRGQNGQLILGRSTHTPFDVTLAGTREFGGFFELLSVYYKAAHHAIAQTFDYATILLSLTSHEQQVHMVDVENCKLPKKKSNLPPLFTAILSKLNTQPGSLLGKIAMLVPKNLCNESFLDLAILGDGSRHALLDKRTPPVLSGNDIYHKRPGLEWGDEIRAAKLMKRIASIGERYGRKVVFLILPVYEKKSPRRSIANQIFSKTLERVPELTVIDHRELFLGPEYFFDYEHPSYKYFELLVNELKNRNLLSARGEGAIRVARE